MNPWVSTLPEIRAFLFDMDGVIVDSNPLHRLAWTEYNRRYGIETSEAMFQSMYGKRNDKLIRDFLGPELTDEEVFAHGAAKEALYREMLLPRIAASLVPGLREFLLRHRELPKAVATNAEPANVEFVFREAALAEYFQGSVDGQQVVHPKPHPEVYLKAADLLGIAPQYCVVFEDSQTGVDAGVAAGMRVIGLSTTHDDLNGVSLLIKDFRAPTLEQWLAREAAVAIPATAQCR